MICLWYILHRGGKMITLNGKNYKNTDELFHDAEAMSLDIQNSEKIKFEKYAKLQKIGRALQLPTPLAVLQIQVKNPNQKEHGILKISDSWVRNQYTYQQQCMALANWTSGTFGSGLFSGKTTANALEVGCLPLHSSPETVLGYYAPANEDSRGIVVGSGTTAESLDSYVLATPIANGNNAGQMAYNACEVTKTWSSPTWTAAWVRIINNNSGGTITVNECALCMYLFHNYAWPGDYSFRTFMMNRDKLSSGEAILDAGQLTVTYNIVITFP